MNTAPQTLSEKLLKKGFWLYLFSFIIAPLGYIIKIIVSQDLSVSEIGILYGIISLISLLSAFSDFGIRESLAYFIPQFTEKKQEYHIKLLLIFGFVIQLVTGIIIFCLFLFGAEFIAIHYFKSDTAIEVLKIFAFFFLGINLFQLINSFFLAIQNTFLQKITEFIRMMFVMFSVLVLYVSDIGTLVSYSYAWIVGLYIGVIISLIIFYKKYYRQYISSQNIIYDGDIIKQIFVYSSITFFSVQSFFILSQIDMQMVLYMLGSVDAGYYTNYLSIVSIPNMILGPIFLLLFPLISELNAQNKNGQIRKIKSLFQKHFFVVSISFSTLFFIFALPISTVLFGDKFLMSGIILQYSVLFLSFNFLLRINHIILAATGQTKIRLYVVLMSIIINLILNYIFISLYGVTGAALATGISWIIIWFITEYILSEYKTKFDTIYILKNLLFFITSGICMSTIILPIFSRLSRIQDLLLLTGVSMVFFCLFLIFNKSEVSKFIGEVRKMRN